MTTIDIIFPFLEVISIVPLELLVGLFSVHVAISFILSLLEVVVVEVVDILKFHIPMWSFYQSLL